MSGHGAAPVTLLCAVTGVLFPELAGCGHCCSASDLEMCGHYVGGDLAVGSHWCSGCDLALCGHCCFACDLALCGHYVPLVTLLCAVLAELPVTLQCAPTGDLAGCNHWCSVR